MNNSINIDRLKECREKMGISKMEAAKRMSLSQPAYLRYESGARTPSFQTLTVIAEVLNTSVEYLTNVSNDPHPISYTVSKLDDPELFELVKLYKGTDCNKKNRLLLYAKKLSS